MTCFTIQKKSLEIVWVCYKFTKGYFVAEKQVSNTSNKAL